MPINDIPCPMREEYGNDCECTALDSTIVPTALSTDGATVEDHHGNDEKPRDGANDALIVAKEPNDADPPVSASTHHETPSDYAEATAITNRTGELISIRKNLDKNLGVTVANAAVDSDIATASSEPRIVSESLVGNVTRLVKLKVQKALQQTRARSVELIWHDSVDESSYESKSLAGELSRAVKEAIRLGNRRKCPICGYETKKTPDSLMTICKNVRCRCRWCICCGRAQYGSFCQACDGSVATASPGQVTLVRSCKGLSTKCSSVRDFYRRKILYFLKKIKDSVSPMHWQLLRCQIELHVSGSFSWDDIDQATCPRYGLTHPHNIDWESDMNDVIASLKETLNSIEGRPKPCGPVYEKESPFEESSEDWFSQANASFHSMDESDDLFSRSKASFHSMDEKFVKMVVAVVGVSLILAFRLKGKLV